MNIEDTQNCKQINIPNSRESVRRQRKMKITACVVFAASLTVLPVVIVLIGRLFQ